MDDTWIEEWQKEYETQKRDNSNVNDEVTCPLPNGLCALIKREAIKLKKDPNDIIKQVEELVCLDDKIMLKSDLTKMFTSQLGDDTASFVHKIMSYKKKVCRNDGNCTRGDLCVFKHLKNKRNITHIDDNLISTPKRHKRQDEGCTEVILNKVSDISEHKIKDYALQFGPIRQLKFLHAKKWLIRFEKPADALKCVNDKTPAFDDLTVTKFFNKSTQQMTPNDFNAMFERQSLLINELYISCDKQKLDELKWISNLIKSIMVKPGVKKKEGRIHASLISDMDLTDLSD